jgi:hypothetical protein
VLSLQEYESPFFTQQTSFTRLFLAYQISTAFSTHLNLRLGLLERRVVVPMSTMVMVIPISIPNENRTAGQEEDG